MSRCEYDTIFQRVFWVTLVAIAFTFTVILTNVFIDIDGLLSRRDRVTDKTYSNIEPMARNERYVGMSPNDKTGDLTYKARKSDDKKTDDTYRSKRSLESQNFLFHIKNPRMKSILTSRLAMLLDELDNEESSQSAKRQNIENSVEKSYKSDETDITKRANNIHKAIIKPKKQQTVADSIPDIPNDEILHLTMHNILLQGMIRHTDLNEVYKKLYLAINSLRDSKEVEEQKIKQNSSNKVPLQTIDDPKTIEKIARSKIKNSKDDLSVRSMGVETKFLEEIAECDKLHNDIEESEKSVTFHKDDILMNKHLKSPNVLIKTIIDITSKKNGSIDNKNSNENIKGVVQVIYNGKSMKFSRIADDNKNTMSTKNPTESTISMAEKRHISNDNLSKVNKSLTNEKNTQLKSEYITKLIAEYIQNNPSLLNKISTEIDTEEKSKRLKRQLKIRYKGGHVDNQNKLKHNSVTKSDDDELYVEIETHFDSKGLKGEKKKKLIQSLIDKIQKAIHSDIDLIKGENKTNHKRFHVKKRIQHPLELNTTLFLNKFTIPVANTGERYSDSYSKSVKKGQPVPLITSKSGDTWKKTYLGPGFLTASKSLNSAELGEVNVDYDKVMAFNGIPQRLQRPLNTDLSQELKDTNTYFDLGNLKFYIKNLAGTGLAIGFNQYTDEPPDTETLNFFNGVENVVNNFNQNNDDTLSIKNVSDTESNEQIHSLFKRDVQKSKKHHIMATRSAKKRNCDYLLNEYNIIFHDNNNNYEPPFDNFEEITEDETKKVTVTLRKNTNASSAVKDTLIENISNNNLPALVNYTTFYENRKPSEILNFANLLNRKKRNVRKISNTNSKLRHNKYINTNKKVTKKLILNKKRNKREIDKIRIIATDTLSQARRSAEDILFVPDENLLADRAVIREVETLDEPIEDMNLRHDKTEDNYHNIIPFIYEDSLYHQYANKLRHSPLMSKYPHIFMEEISHPKEKYERFAINKIEIKPLNHKYKYRIETTETPPGDVITPKVEEIISAISPRPNQNYRLTVKITPKNVTHLNSGFKEIHTSINKSFTSNGLVYSSLVNVSEISKIEKQHDVINATTIMSPATFSKKSSLQQQLEDQRLKMDALLKQHKILLNEQFENLTRERMNTDINSLLNLTPITKRPIETISTSPPLIPQIDISRILASALRQLQAQNHTIRTEPISTTPTSRPSNINSKEFEKIAIIKSMEKNENLTNRILEKLDKNTETLQTLLTKLIRSSIESKNNNDLTDIGHVASNLPNQTWKPLRLSYMQNPIQETRKNDSEPFMYLQQHYPLNYNSKSVPIASIVYHGLVNHLPSKDLNANPKDSHNIVNNNDQGRYFIDGIANGYKILPTTKSVNRDKDFVMKSNNTTLH